MAEQNDKIERIEIEVRFGRTPQFTVNAYEPGNDVGFNCGGDGKPGTEALLHDILSIIDDVYASRAPAAKLCIEGITIVRQSRCGT